MKKIIFALLVLAASNIFAQKVSTFKTDPVFYISFTNYDKEEINFEDIRITNLDSISLSFDETIYGQNSNENKFKERKVVFDRINKFGYKVGLSKGEIIRNGALIGFGIGFTLGAIEGKINPVGDGSGKPTVADRIGTEFLFGLVTAIPVALLTSVFFLDSKEYEVLNISKYERHKKFEIIKRLIKKGVKENE
ncbi:MAG: hypothetical protein JSS63_13660 [Bacteroidetes bacterium]|nr:hypothetical protein [Bacteroidota bacterium]